MTNFEIWMLLVLGVWFTISSVISLYEDIKKKGETRWWKWVLDPLGLFVGIWFLCEFFIVKG